MKVETLIRYLTMAIVIITAFPIHELAHALVADRLGDHTAREQGRLTMNPFAHLDLFGTLALLLFGFGWAKPVPINPSHFKKPKRDLVLTALAGPLSNLCLAFLLMIVFKVYLSFANMGTTAGIVFGQVIYTILWTNLMLALFNLLPVPPLDGSRVALLLLPRNLYFRVMRYERVILVILLAMVWFGVFNQPLAWLNDSMWQLMGKATGYIDQLAYSIYYSQFVSGV